MSLEKALTENFVQESLISIKTYTLKGQKPHVPNTNAIKSTTGIRNVETKSCRNMKMPRLKKNEAKAQKEKKKLSERGRKKAQREGLPVDQRFRIYIPVSSILYSLIWLKPTFTIQAKMIV